MKIKQSINKLDFYEMKYKLPSSFIFLLIPKKLRNKLLQLCTYDRRHLLTILDIIIRSIIFGGIAYLGYTKTYLSPFSYFMFIITFLLFFLWLIVQGNVKTVFYPLNNNHYYRLLGDNRYDYINYHTKKPIKNGFLKFITPVTIIFAIAQAIEFKNVFILINYLLIILFIYYIFLISSIIIEYILEVIFRRFPIIESIIIIVSFYIVGILILFILGIFYLISNYFASYSLNNIGEIPLLINLIFGVYLILLIYILDLIYSKPVDKFIKTKLIDVVKIERYRKSNNTNEINSALTKKESFFTKILLWRRNKIEKTIIKKDYLMLMRGYKNKVITYWLNCFLGLYGIVFAVALADATATLDDVIMSGLLGATLLLIVIISGLFSFKDYTWYSSEGANKIIYYKMNVDKYNIYKAKTRINKLILLPIFLVFFSSSSFTNFGLGQDKYIIYGFINIYIYLLSTLLIEFIIYTDIMQPKNTSVNQVYWIGDNINFFTFMFVLVFFHIAIIEIVKPKYIGNNQLVWKFILLGILSVLVILRIILYIKAKRLNKIGDRRVLNDTF